MQRPHRMLCISVVVLLLLSITAQVFFAPTAAAYTSRYKWLSQTTPYQIDPRLDQDLNPGVVGADQEVRRAANAWNKSSNLTLLYTPGFDPNSQNARFISTGDLSLNGAANACNVHGSQWAITCYTFGGNNTLISSKTLFNISQAQDPGNDPMRWNTGGVVGFFNGVRAADVYNLALHELGHWQHLADVGNGSVMNFAAVPKPTLTDDDKQGATMIYGPYTSFEVDEARWPGYSSFVYAANVSNPSITPLGVDNINNSGYFLYPRSGNGQLRLLGSSTAAYSYAYQKLFTYEDDGDPDIVQSRPYATISSGTFLHWCQVNTAQSTMSIDLYFDDDSTLRDARRPNGDLFRDTNGVPVHPALRGGYGTNQWWCFDVDLSDLAGKKILRWMVAYDNGNNGATGEYRAYFDDVQLRQVNVQGQITGVIGSGSVNASPAGPYAPNTNVTFTAVPSPGWVFTGWTINGYREGWPNPLTARVDQRFTLVANFAQQSTFPDVPSSSTYYEAVRQLTVRGVIAGYTNGNFGPNDIVQRAQSAAFIARAIPSSTITNGSWDNEDWGNPFSDSGGIAPSLWRDVGTLYHYGVAAGYDASSCAARGVAYPCFGPTDQVLEVQVIAYISRAMVAKGYWAWRPSNCTNYSGVTQARQEICTYVYYAGGISFSQTGGLAPGTRGWFAQQWWQALNSYFSVDRIP